MAPLTEKSLVATWSAKGRVNIWDITSHMTALSLPAASAAYQSVKGLKEEPLFSFSGHQVRKNFTLHNCVHTVLKVLI